MALTYRLRANLLVASLLGMGFMSGFRAVGQEMSDVKITAQHVAGSVHMLTGRGGNIGVSAGDDGLLMIDDQFEPLADKIRQALRDIHPGELKFVLNTHWHGDHTGGNVSFGKEALLLAHEKVRDRLATEQTIRGRSQGPLPPEGWPVVTFEDGLYIHFNGERIEVVHYPSGHTDGDAVVYFPESGVVHTGDLFFSGRFPFVDLDHGGDVEGLTRNVGKILARIKPGTRIIPGHGPLSTVDDLKAYHKMLEDTTAYIRKRVEGKLDLESAKQQGLPKKYDSWGEGFISTESWIETVYRSLDRKSKP